MKELSIYKIWVIARYELVTTVLRRSYLFMVLGMPLVFLVLASVEMYLVTRALREEQPPRAAVIDRAQVFNSFPATEVATPIQPIEEVTKSFQSSKRLVRMVDTTVELQTYDDLNRALEELSKKQLFAVYLVEADYVQTGKIVTYIRETRIASLKNQLGEQRLAEALRARLLEGRLPADVRSRALHPARFERFEVLPQGGRKPETPPAERMLSLMAPIMLCGFLSMTIFFSSGYLTQSLIHENRSRVMEVLLCAVRPGELLLGKMIGLGLAGFLPAMLYGSLPMLGLAPYFATRGWVLALLSALYFVLGYLLFSILLTATGVIVNGMQERTRLAGIWSFLSGLPVILFIFSSEMNSWMARALAWFPPTAPTTMLIRLSYGRIASWDILLSIFMLLAGILFALWATIKIFRTSTLMYGQGYDLRELRRWLVEA